MGMPIQTFGELSMSGANSRQIVVQVNDARSPDRIIHIRVTEAAPDTVRTLTVRDLTISSETRPVEAKEPSRSGAD